MGAVGMSADRNNDLAMSDRGHQRRWHPSTVWWLPDHMQKFQSREGAQVREGTGQMGGLTSDQRS